MTMKQTLNIIAASVVACLIICVIILSCVISSQHKTIIIMRQEKNYLSQTLDKMKKEQIEQQIILDEKNELLLEVKKATTLKEYLAVWDKVNRSLK